MSDLTHFDADGNAQMVDVSNKAITRRTATARAVMRMKIETAEQIKQGSIGKGDVLGVARVAGIMGTKSTAHLIPLCHPIGIDSANVDFEWLDDPDQALLEITCNVLVTAKTGVEMEALTGASVAALTVYDMCKSIDREMEIRSICLLKKSGGKSGTFVRNHGLASKE